MFDKLQHQVKDDVKKAVLSLCDAEEGASLLDCGCADGVFTRCLGEEIGARRVTGLDLLDVNIRSAANNGVEAYRADLNDRLQFGDAQFDVVVANEVIQYLINPDSLLKEIRRVLKNRGYVILSTTNLSSLHNIVLLLFGRQPPMLFVSNEVPLSKWDRLPAQGIPETSARASCAGRFFTLKAMKDMLEFHGFTVEMVKASGYYPLPAPLGRVMNVLDKTHSAYFTVKARKS